MKIRRAKARKVLLQRSALRNPVRPFVPVGRIRNATKRQMGLNLSDVIRMRDRLIQSGTIGAWEGFTLITSPVLERRA